MVIRGLPFSLHSITKSSNALLVHLPIGVCLLTFAMCLPLFRGAWSAFSETWYKESWKCSWVISLFKGKILMIVSKIWRKFWRGLLRRVSFWIGRNVTCWDWATKSKIWCNKVRLNYSFFISLVYLWTLTRSTGPTRLTFKRKERNEKVGVFQFWKTRPR